MSYANEKALDGLQEMTFVETMALAEELIEQMVGNVDFAKASEGDISVADVAMSLVEAAKKVAAKNAEKEST